MIAEHNEQVALIKWFRFVAPVKGVDSRLLYAIPNGGWRAKPTAYSIKQEGGVAGVPDLFLAVARDGKHGLYIEMKRFAGGKVSAAQKEMIELLKGQGFEAIVARGVQAGIEAICQYMGWDIRKQSCQFLELNRRCI